MAGWPTAETSSDSDIEDEVSGPGGHNHNHMHSSYDYWYSYYERRKQKNMQQKLNSNQRSYHKYQRNFVPNYHHVSKTPPLIGTKSNTNIKKEHEDNTNNEQFNTHIVPTSVVNASSADNKTASADKDVISPFLRVQQNKKKMPYNYSNVSLASLASIVNTPSQSDTPNTTNILHQQLEQLKQRNIFFDSSAAHVHSNVVSDCMKATQCCALSSLMFTTPQKFTYFQQHRHLYFHHEEFTKQRELFVKQWRAKECDKRAMRTMGIIIALCLNIGIDPPDIVRTNPCSVYECWINPTQLPASRASEVIATGLKQQYSAWKGKQRKLNIQKILDGNPEQVRQTCLQLRQYATDRRVIFHYNGHGVPRPTEHGELWFFNSNFSEYLPVSILDIAQWLQTPSMIVLDCSCAGKIVSSFKQYEPILKQQQKQKEQPTDTDSLYRFGTMILAACAEHEILPMNPEYPNDIFTSCLTSPIKMALKWFISTQLMDDDDAFTFNNESENAKENGKDDYEHKFNKDNDNKYMALLDMIFDPAIGGLPSDKKNILGELHWIFLSVTDTIAWNVLPNKLFQNLFRLDYTIQALFRNYLLAERIMKSMNRNPVSYPSLPSTNNHPMWQSWDSAVDAALLQLKQFVTRKNQWQYQQLLKKQKVIQKDEEEEEAKSDSKAIQKDLEPKLIWKDSSFFAQQLRAFEVWIETGEIQKKPYHLPIVLQAVLNKQYRLKALTLLSRYLDLGPWTVNYVLWVGLHSYFKLLLKQCINDDKKKNPNSKTLRYSLTFIWAKILAHDPSCRHDLIASKHYVFFYKELKRKDNSDQQIFLSTFILAQIASKQPTGQQVLLSKACGGHKKSNKYSLLNILKTNIFHPNNNIKIWSILCIAKMWQNLDQIKSIAYDVTDCLILQLSSICIQVRAVTMYALGTFFNLRDVVAPAVGAADQSPLLGAQLDLTLGHQLTKLVHDPSPIIRMELVFVLSSLIYYQQEQFRDYYNKQKLYKKEQRRQQKLSHHKPHAPPRKKSGGFFSKSHSHTASHSQSISPPQHMPARSPTLQTTHSMPPEKRPQFEQRATKSANPHHHSGLSPMIAPTHTLNDAEQRDEQKDEDYEQRKRIWEVIKVFCRDPIGEISRNANKVKHYMTSDKVKSKRSRALSDPEKHAKVALDPRGTMNNAEESEKKESFVTAHHSKSNTIFGALSDTLSNIGRSAHHRKVASQQSVTPSGRNMKGKSAFFVDDDDEDYNKGKKADDPLWNIPDSPLFSWLTEHISRPLTNAMYDAPDPLYHELDAKNLPLIDPRLTMSNFFYHQEQHKYDEEQKVLAKKMKEEDNKLRMNSRFKLRYSEMNATLALNYIRLAAIRSWEIRKFYMLQQRAKAQWRNLLRLVDPSEKEGGDDVCHHLRSATEQSLASSSFTLPSGMIHDDNKPRVRSLSNDFTKSATKKKKILSFLGGKMSNDIKASESSHYLSPNMKRGDEISRSLDTPIMIPADGATRDSPLSTAATSPFISPYVYAAAAEEEAAAPHTPQQVDSPSIYYHLYNDNLPQQMDRDSASKFMKSGMRINNQIERYDTDCDGGITAIKFHPFRNILYCADSAGRVWVWKYATANGQRRINVVNIGDTHLSRSGSNNNLLPTNNNISHSRSFGNFSDINLSSSAAANEATGDHITSFEIINKYHDTMLLCAGDDGTIRIYRNTHLDGSMSAVTAFLANARIKPTRNTNSCVGKMITSWCSEFGYLYSGGSHNTVKIHDCHNEAYFGSFYTKCNTTSMLGGDDKNTKNPNVLIAACADNRVRVFDLRTNLNTNNATKEIEIATKEILSIKPHTSSSDSYYICSTQELCVFDLRNEAVATRIPFKKYINTFDSHRFAPIYALGSTKQFVQICSSIKLKKRSKKNKDTKQSIQSVNEICYHDGFLGARIGPVRLLQFHPYKLLLAVGGTNKHLSLYSSSNLKN